MRKRRSAGDPAARNQRLTVTLSAAERQALTRAARLAGRTLNLEAYLRLQFTLQAFGEADVSTLRQADFASPNMRRLATARTCVEEMRLLLPLAHVSPMYAGERIARDIEFADPGDPLAAFAVVAKNADKWSAEPPLSENEAAYVVESRRAQRLLLLNSDLALDERAPDTFARFSAAPTFDDFSFLLNLLEEARRIFSAQTSTSIVTRARLASRHIVSWFGVETLLHVALMRDYFLGLENVLRTSIAELGAGQDERFCNDLVRVAAPLIGSLNETARERWRQLCEQRRMTVETLGAASAIETLLES
jgi:hypothetical protein